MSDIFEVPCPECGQSLSVAEPGLECPDCRLTYRSRMGHLVPMAESASATIAAPAGRRPATPART